MIKLTNGNPDKTWWIGAQVKCDCGFAGQLEAKDEHDPGFYLNGNLVAVPCPDCGCVSYKLRGAAAAQEAK